MEIHIRPAVEADIAAIVLVQARAMVDSDFYAAARDEQAESLRLRPRVAGYLSGVYHPSNSLSERAVLVASTRDRIVGFVAGHRSTRLGCTAELQWMFVLPRWQRRGVGTRLLAAITPWFVDHSSSRVIVDAGPDNPSRPFYLKHGATPLDNYWLYWPDIGSHIYDARNRGAPAVAVDIS